MNMGLKILLLHWIIMGCASTPKPTARKKVGTTATAAKPAKGSVSKGPMKPAGKAPPPPPPVEEEAVEEEEEDDQFSRIKKYYKK